MSVWSHFNLSAGYFEPIQIVIGKGEKDDHIKTSHSNYTDASHNVGLTTPIMDIYNETLAPPWVNSSVTTVDDNNSSAIFNCSANNNTMNCSEAAVGQSMMPEPFPIEQQIVLIIVYSLTSFLAVFGNIIVIIVFSKGKKSKSDLTPFLINLACSDLIMAIFCIPFTFTPTMLRNWVFPDIMCPMVLYLQTVAVTASVSTNMAIGLDRFWVVQFPLKSRAVGGKRSKIVICIIWGIALGLSVVQLVIGRVRAHDLGNGIVLKECMEKWPNNIYRRTYTFFILILTYLLPLCILIVAYTIVGVKLWKRTAPGEKDSQRDRQQNKSKRKVVQMLVTIVGLFGICWFPIHLFALVLDFRPDLMEYEDILTIIYYCVHWLAMSNSFQNPIIYGFLNDSFKIDLRIILSKWFPYCCKYKRPLTRDWQTTIRNGSQYHRSNSAVRQTRPRDDSSSGSGSVKTNAGGSQQRLIKKPKAFEKLGIESPDATTLLLNPSINRSPSTTNEKTVL